MHPLDSAAVNCYGCSKETNGVWQLANINEQQCVDALRHVSRQRIVAPPFQHETRSPEGAKEFVQWVFVADNWAKDDVTGNYQKVGLKWSPVDKKLNQLLEDSYLKDPQSQFVVTYTSFGKMVHAANEGRQAAGVDYFYDIGNKLQIRISGEEYTARVVHRSIVPREMISMPQQSNDTRLPNGDEFAQWRIPQDAWFEICGSWKKTTVLACVEAVTNYQLEQSFLWSNQQHEQAPPFVINWGAGATSNGYVYYVGAGEERQLHVQVNMKTGRTRQLYRSIECAIVKRRERSPDGMNVDNA